MRTGEFEPNLLCQLSRAKPLCYLQRVVQMSAGTRELTSKEQQAAVRQRPDLTGATVLASRSEVTAGKWTDLLHRQFGKSRNVQQAADPKHAFRGM